MTINLAFNSLNNGYFFTPSKIIVYLFCFIRKSYYICFENKANAQLNEFSLKSILIKMVEYKFKKGSAMTVLLTDNTLNQDNFAIIEAKHTEDDFNYDRSYLIGNIVNERFLASQAKTNSEVLEKWYKNNIYDVLNGLVINKTAPENEDSDVPKTGAFLQWDAIQGADKIILKVKDEAGLDKTIELPGDTVKVSIEGVLGLEELVGSATYTWTVNPVFGSGKVYDDPEEFQFTTVA